MNRSLDNVKRGGQPASAGSSARRGERGRGFTLVEMMVVVAIIGLLLSISAYGFRRMTEQNALALARNAVVTYAKVARSYAIANHVETMMVVNPFNGRFELWHLNPPVFGGDFDPLSAGLPGAGGVATQYTDGYAYAPVLDSGARLPVDGQGRPLAAVHPLDYANVPVTRPLAADADERNLDNLTWAALCFNASGELVIRTRRIATRTFYYRDGSPRAANERNRLIDEMPDLAIREAGNALVFGGAGGDTPITSAWGFVISDATKMRRALGASTLPADLVNRWLFQTRTGGSYAGFADTVLLNRYSGDELRTTGAAG